MIATFWFGTLLDSGEDKQRRNVISSRRFRRGNRVWFIEVDRCAVTLGFGTVESVTCDGHMVTLVDGTKLPTNLCFTSGAELEHAIAAMKHELMAVIGSTEPEEQRQKAVDELTTKK